ncbi:MAG: deoxynucleoside kinase [Bacteroidetes bacterium]|nr:deoxynucleoside kinase [Bacteroidota bacterium]MXW82524.1 deoxynucleoside kinase [Rhodothermaceae bacterium]MDE2671728.1 deoxynucleoside kinase [Bacteroidota bacterium]MXX57490.1 deoxynucleoside kinase [Rhodothermaceae bacterium]MYD19566.1 deoxynucleoside kinase [Rhodothermaceae bacterium]
MKSAYKGHTDTLPDNLRYVAIEGVIGVGKSQLASLLAKRFELRLVLEDFEENPFLSRFYRNPSRWAFQTQIAFLTSRYRQLSTLRTLDLFHTGVVTDYSFDKDQIFAHMYLSGEEVYLYDKLYGQMERSTPKPDLIIYIQSSLERSLERIRERDLPYERGIDIDLLKRLREAYVDYFFRYTKSPLLNVNVEQMDFEQRPEDLDELSRIIVETDHYGITYFNPSKPELFK